MIQIGIDPGISGALAVLDTETRQVKFYDTPTVTVRSGKKLKNQMDAAAIALLLNSIAVGKDVLVTIEKVNAMPGWKNDPDNPGERVQASMGVTSAFNFGFGYGVWIGLLTALMLPFQQIHPLTWKRAMMQDMGKEKDASRIKAMQLFPLTAKDLSLRKSHNRADALLLAAWGSKNCTLTKATAPDPEWDSAPSLF